MKSSYINPHGASLLRWCLQRIRFAFSLYDEASIVLRCRGVIEVNVGDSIKIRATARLLLILVRVVNQHLSLTIKHKPAIVGS